MNKALPKLTKKDGYARILLEFLQKNPKLEVAWVDFFKKKWFPFLGQYPTARCSELSALWLLDRVGNRKNELKNINNIFLYKINEKGLKFKF